MVQSSLVHRGCAENVPMHSGWGGKLPEAVMIKQWFLFFLNYFKFCFYLQANAGVEPFPRAFLWALPQGQGTFSLSVEQRVNAAFEFCLVFYALGPLSNGEYDEVIMEIHKLQPHEYQRKSWWSMLKECIKMQIICKWGAVNLVSINNLEHLIASGLDEF